MVSTRSRGPTPRITSAFKKNKKERSSARKIAANAKKAKVALEPAFAPEEAVKADALDESPAKDAISEPASSEDTVLIADAEKIDQIEEVNSPEDDDDLDDDLELDSMDEDEDEELRYEDLRAKRMTKNRAMITGLGLNKMKGQIAKKRKTPARRARASKPRGEGAEPSRKSGRSRKPVERLGNFVDEEALAMEMLRQRQAAAQRKNRRAIVPRRFTRGDASKQENAKAVYKKVMKPVKKEEELKCSPLSKDKLEWARREMIDAYAAEYKLDEEALSQITQKQKDDMASGPSVLLSRVAYQLERFVLPSMYSDLDAKRGSYKSQSAYFGQPPGVPVGTLWLSRVECSKDTVHGPWVGGIAGSGKTGAYSIVLSGGYEGDTDDGASFTYTGSGGRDLTGNKRTAPQSSDQVLKGCNLALAVNLLRNRPLRVVRGYKLAKRSDYAPHQGYRYDGLYRVTEVWPEQGPSGFVIWRYKMEREPGQDDPPWTGDKWQEAEAEALAKLEEEKGAAPLIPVGTGTLGMNKEFREIMKQHGC